MEIGELIITFVSFILQNNIDRFYAYCRKCRSGYDGSFTGQDSPASDGLHQSAAAWIGESVSTKQVFVATETFWGGHVTHADRDPGKDLVPESTDEMEAE